MIFLHHALFVVSVLAMSNAAFRLASSITPRGLDRVLVTAVFGAAGAVGAALLLGIFSLASSAAALSILAVATWMTVRWLLPTPKQPVGREIARWWTDRSAGERLAIGALIGASLGWAAWMLYRPMYGIDGMAYHTPEVAYWMQSGTTGAADLIVQGHGVEYYPLVNEVLSAWGVGLAHSFVPYVLVTPAFLALLVMSGWLGLRALGVSRGRAALAIATLCTVPAFSRFFYESYTDLPALAWLACAGALSVRSRRQPALLPAVIVAGGLAIGTKTTVVPVTLVLLAATIYQCRGSLRPFARPLLIATGAFSVVGLFWYARNLVLHGSPFWPFSASPWGDPVPFPLSEQTTRLVERPIETLRAHAGDFRFWVAGGFVLLAGAFSVALMPIARSLRWLAVIVGLALCAYAIAPTTGLPEDPTRDLSLFNVRFILPAVAVATLTLALATRQKGAAAKVATAFLVLALLWNLAEASRNDLGFLGVPSLSPQALFGGLVAGALAAWLTSTISSARLSGITPPRTASVGLAVGLLVAALALGSVGYVDRLALATDHGRDVVRWFTSQPEFADTERPISGSPSSLGLLAGDHFEHHVSTLPANETCAQVRTRAQRGWIVIKRGEKPVTRAAACLRSLDPLHSSNDFLVFGSSETDNARAGQDLDLAEVRR